jgi:uroporphyrinogen decarboxylase
MPEMTIRERALAAINHELPDRVPPNFMGMFEQAKYAESIGEKDHGALLDRWGVASHRTGFAGPKWNGPQRKTEDDKPLSIWGTVWVGQPYNFQLPRPLADAETVADVDAHDWPDPDNYDFVPLSGVLKDLPYLRMWGAWQPIFCLLSDLFSMERMLLNIHYNPAVVEAALAHIEHFYTEFYKKEVAACGDVLDILAFGDDFADQRSLLLRPEDWRRLFLPLWKKWFAFGKEKNLKIWMHACGAIAEVLPDLVDAGLDVWETAQVHLPGADPKRLKKRFGKNLAYAGGINTQHVLAAGTPDQVRQHTRERIRVLGRGGGYLCGPDHSIMPEVPFENVTALFDTIMGFRGEGCTL